MNSLKLISNHKVKLLKLLFSLFLPYNLFVIIRNIISYFSGFTWDNYILRNKIRFDDLILKTVNWIKTSQDNVGSGGIGCFEFYGWTRGYPEVTGYIIPTVWDCYNLYLDKDLKERAISMADWEISIQRPDGGWEGYYEGDGMPSIVFNSGQVIRGLLRTFKETNNEKYLESAMRAADWIVATQDSDGSWSSNNYKQMKRVYDTYVCAPLSELYIITKDKKYKKCVIKNCEFSVSNQNHNGWFSLADNTLLNNEAPILHTIAYTIDGLYDVGVNLKEQKFIESAKLAADSLLHKIEIYHIISARFDNKWRRRSKYSCLTGNAQLGIIFMKLYEKESDPRYLNAALKIADFLAYTQSLNSMGQNRKGGIAGSYPIWGMYCPLKYPSWAAKYFIDLSILIKKNISE